MNILDIFYNSIIMEASIGRINSYGKSNMIFSTVIKDDDINIKSKTTNDNLIIPTLYIKNKNEFNKLLIEYVTKAKKFYDDISDLENEYELNESDNKEKFIMTRLWANATLEDFQDPISFLRNRITFFNANLNINNDLGYSNTLKTNVRAELVKDIIDNQTPYKLVISLIDNDDNRLQLPSVKLGIVNDKAYIYAIQKDNKEDYKETKFGKKINRSLYKINDGFFDDLDNEELFDSGNLKDVTSSFLLSANICLSLLEKNGINEVIVPSIIIERWNSREIKNEYLKNRSISKLNVSDEDKINEINDKFLLNEKRNDFIQENLTEKLLRTFRRLDYHHTNIDISSFPSELDTLLHLKFNHTKDICNNKLLEETYNLEKGSNKTK